MAYVEAVENEPIEKTLRRFKKKVQREAIMKDIKKSGVYLPPGQKRRLKDIQARKRMRRRLRRQRNNEMF